MALPQEIVQKLEQMRICLSEPSEEDQDQDSVANLDNKLGQMFLNGSHPNGVAGSPGFRSRKEDLLQSLTQLSISTSTFTTPAPAPTPTPAPVFASTLTPVPATTATSTATTTRSLSTSPHTSHYKNSHILGYSSSRSSTASPSSSRPAPSTNPKGPICPFTLPGGIPCRSGTFPICATGHIAEFLATAMLSEDIPLFDNFLCAFRIYVRYCVATYNGGIHSSNSSRKSDRSHNNNDNSRSSRNSREARTSRRSDPYRRTQSVSSNKSYDSFATISCQGQKKSMELEQKKDKKMAGMMTEMELS
ncbi:hypothetical protein BX616_005534 [Lobosporangium transversale]|uniref:Uncharacterized protein n=1 Tax=Lobosporangium transversale TaxID=64571 RepID=A0A1Y2GCG8_9FUNG|nr:hypothetical protein BCR41DRAFT_360468 [Lobosporangium transversale]KAF9897471.1 hypothetical protein BX616_005534 [Lobosporangium transversale]ORZ07000.1 hypothetical protein BCR41DRAFT_360468 [Lobosporangium transversale]|eukprot:XP_021877796.1 hypothetical protein BCR41DRAFT_360468 [Lobosporangium transversale]